MRKFLGPEGEVEALRITHRTFHYPNPNADRIAGVWYDWRHRCARFVDGDCSQANVGEFIIRHPDGTLSVSAAVHLRDTTGPRGFGWRKEPLSAARKLDGTYMRAVKMVLAVLCFVLGAAFAFGAVERSFTQDTMIAELGCLGCLR